MKPLYLGLIGLALIFTRQFSPGIFTMMLSQVGVILIIAAIIGAIVNRGKHKE